jgi:ribosomal protein S15P/S13E
MSKLELQLLIRDFVNSLNIEAKDMDTKKGLQKIKIRCNNIAKYANDLIRLKRDE